MNAEQKTAFSILVDMAIKKDSEVHCVASKKSLCGGFKHEPMLNAYMLWYNDSMGSTKTVACCDKTLLPLDNQFKIKAS